MQSRLPHPPTPKSDLEHHTGQTRGSPIINFSIANKTYEKYEVDDDHQVFQNRVAPGQRHF